MVDQEGAVVDPPRRLLTRPSLLVALTVLLVGVPTHKGATGVQLASVTPADIGAVLLVAVIGVGVLRSRDLRGLRDPLFLAPALIVVAALVTTAFSTDPVLSLVGAVRYAELFCVVPLAVVLAVRDRTDVRLVFAAIVLLGLVEGAVGVYQSATGTGGGYQGHTTRAIGTFGVEDVLAMADVVSVAMLVLIAFALRGRTYGQRITGTVCAAVLVVPLLLSLSRGALIATIVAFAAMVLSTGAVRALRIGGLVAGAAVCLALIVNVHPTVGEKFSRITERIASVGDVASSPDSSVTDRYNLWHTALEIWQLDPVTGTGIKTFPAYRDSHAPLDLSSGSELVTTTSYTRGELLSPHNEYLLLLSEQGLLGLGSYVLLLLYIAERHGERFRGRGEDRQQVLSLAAVGALVWYAISLLYGDIAGSTAVLYAVLLGLQLRSATAGRSPVPGSAPAQHEAHAGEQDAEGHAGREVHGRVG